jgi:hypothetical protein
MVHIELKMLEDAWEYGFIGMDETPSFAHDSISQVNSIIDAIKDNENITAQRLSQLLKIDIELVKAYCDWLENKDLIGVCRGKKKRYFLTFVVTTETK